MNEKDIPKDIEEALNDETIREWFLSRDPNRKKVDPFIDEDTALQYSGKASPLSTKEQNDEDKDKLYGISFSQHQKHIRDVAKHFTWIGISIGFIISIILTFIF